MGRFENAEVFRDTERMCRENARLRESIAASRKGQRLVLEGVAVDVVERNRYAEAAQVVVSPKRTFEAAMAYAGDGDVRVEISAADLQTLHERRLRRIFDVAALNGAEAIVLGAFGCGAFRNDPKVVAAAAKNVVAEYRHAFRAIEFAVYCRPGDTANFDAFARNCV